MKRGPEEQTLDIRPSKRVSTRGHSLVRGGSAATNAGRSRFKCVKRAAVRDGFDQKISRRIGFVEVGECIDALECRTNESGVIRVRFEQGWLSCTSQKGDVLLQPVATRPVGHGCRCCGKIGHLKAKCPYKDQPCDICGKARSHNNVLALRTTRVLTDRPTDPSVATGRPLARDVH